MVPCTSLLVKTSAFPFIYTLSPCQISASFLFIQIQNPKQPTSVIAAPSITPETLIIYNTMYRKVKVRDEDDRRTALHDHEWTSLLSLKDIQSLSLHESCSPVKQHRNVSSPLVAKILEPRVSPDDVMPVVSISQAKEEKSDRKEKDEERPNIRVSTTPRPRAVLSSPDNDALIGRRNRVEAERDSVSKSRNLASNRHGGRYKVISSNVINESPPVSAKMANDAAGDKGEVKGKKGSATSISSQRRNVRLDKRSPLSAYKPDMKF